MDLNLGAMLFVLGLFWALLFAARLRLSFIHIMAVVWTLYLVNLYTLGAQNSSFLPLYLFEGGLVAFAAGIFGSRFMRPGRYWQATADMDISPTQQRTAFLAMLIVGIPVLVLGVMLFVLKG